jgi:hypothetical protein
MAVSSTQVSSNPGVSTRTNLLPLSEALCEESMTLGAKLGSARGEVVTDLCYLRLLPCNVIDELETGIVSGKAVKYAEVLTVLFPAPVGPMILKGS